MTPLQQARSVGSLIVGSHLPELTVVPVNKGIEMCVSGSASKILDCQCSIKGSYYRMEESKGREHHLHHLHRHTGSHRPLPSIHYIRPTPAPRPTEYYATNNASPSTPTKTLLRSPLKLAGSPSLSPIKRINFSRSSGSGSITKRCAQYSPIRPQTRSAQKASTSKAKLHPTQKIKLQNRKFRSPYPDSRPKIVDSKTQYSICRVPSPSFVRSGVTGECKVTRMSAGVTIREYGSKVKNNHNYSIVKLNLSKKKTEPPVPRINTSFFSTVPSQTTTLDPHGHTLSPTRPISVLSSPMNQSRRVFPPPSMVTEKVSKISCLSSNVFLSEMSHNEVWKRDSGSLNTVSTLTPSDMGSGVLHFNTINGFDSYLMFRPDQGQTRTP